MNVFSNLASIMAAVLFVRSIAKEYLPPEFCDFFSNFLRSVMKRVSSYIYLEISVEIEENDGMYRNEVYEAVQAYLSAKSFSAAKRLKLKKSNNKKDFNFTMANNERIADEYEGIKLCWVFHSERKQVSSKHSKEERYYELKFNEKHKKYIVDRYLPHVMAEGKTLQNRSRCLKIYTNRSNSQYWDDSVVFDHPITFRTLALEPALKQDIMEDLQRFSRREEYYSHVGRVWKRGYFLYGPPGTGKSSLIACMAHLLKYDIYDLELTQVTNNTELRNLLIATTNKSIIVIEDIDCSLDLSDRQRKKKKKLHEDVDEEEEPSDPEESKVTLSGVLNFTDGLWSCCGSERLFVFTTNHKERLDPALLRCGRMDKHICLSFCTFGAFRILAHNYLSIEDHDLFPDIQELMETAEMTPADVTEHLMEMADHPTTALQNLIQALRKAPKKDFNDVSEVKASAIEGQV